MFACSCNAYSEARLTFTNWKAQGLTWERGMRKRLGIRKFVLGSARTMLQGPQKFTALHLPVSLIG